MKLVVVLGVLAMAEPIALRMQSSATAVQSSATVSAVAGPTNISRLAWLAGGWQGGDGPLRIEEHWTDAAGGAMLGVSRTIKGDRMVAFEFLRIVERGETLAYIAQPDGRPPTEFTLSAMTDTSATFQNPSHDFPKMIRYAKRADGGLEARISDGGQRGETFVFKRLP